MARMAATSPLAGCFGCFGCNFGQDFLFPELLAGSLR